jgi:hypothetical protein
MTTLDGAGEGDKNEKKGVGGGGRRKVIWRNVTLPI